MCPPEEAGEREATRQLSIFEQSDGTQGCGGRRLPVKAFSRTPDLSPGTVNHLTLLISFLLVVRQQLEVLAYRLQLDVQEPISEEPFENGLSSNGKSSSEREAMKWLSTTCPKKS